MPSNLTPRCVVVLLLCLSLSLFFRGFCASDQSEADAVRLLDKMSASEAGSPDLGRRQQEPLLRGTSGDVNGTTVRIKKEPEEDIKDFAETTMNELLGWYGYDKVNTGETKGINLSLSRFSSSSSPPQEGSESEDGSRDTTESRMLAPDSSGDSAATQLNSGGAGSVIIECSWCSKTGLKLFTLKTSGREPKAFCSELCFNQCRRATFKKSRICDWCKHVRHTVNYVDFQDGAHQLQFCGDKCLNQYKMHIFCKETQAYLQMHPQLQEVARSGSDSMGSKLITPDLWLRDCKDGTNGAGSYNASVHSDDDAEPDGAAGTAEQDEPPPFVGHRTPNIAEPQLSTKSCDAKNTTAFNIWDKIESNKKEFSKPLKSKDASRRNGRQSSRNNESLLSRRPVGSSTSPKPSPLPQARERSPLSPVHINHSAQMNGSPHHTLSTRTSPNLPQPPRIVPSSSPSLPTQQHSHTSSTSSGSSIPPGIPPPPPLINSELFRPPFPPQFYHPSFNYLSQQQQLECFLRAQGSSGLGMRLGMTPPPPPPAHFPHASFSSPFLQPPSPMPITSHSFGSNSLLPPPTIMIPYPLIIPLPLPIPIPIPIPLLGASKKAAKKESADHPEGNSTDSFDPSLTETQDVSLTETCDSPREPNSSPNSKVEEHILIDVEDTRTTDSVVHSPSAHLEEEGNIQLPVKTGENQLTEQPMALTRSKSRNARGFASPRETKRPRLTDRNGL